MIPFPEGYRSRRATLLEALMKYSGISNPELSREMLMKVALEDL